MTPMHCLQCGGGEVRTGALQSTGKVYFRPGGAKFLKMKTANVEVLAVMCLHCGAIRLTGDVDKVRELTAAASA